MKNRIIFLVCCSLLLSMSLACRLASLPSLMPSSPVTSPNPTLVPTPVNIPTPQIILQRLKVSYLGLDGNKLIGSGCPGNYGKGTTVDYHFSVSGVDTYREVTRVVVTGDNSTITWAMPCSDNWELVALDAGGGEWDIFVAPSETSHVYTVLFFYSDHSIALGMTTAP